MSIKGSTQTTFLIGNPTSTNFKIDTTSLTSQTSWFVPNNASGYLKNDGSGNLSWSSSASTVQSGVFVGDLDCGNVANIITADLDFGDHTLPYTAINLGTA